MRKYSKAKGMRDIIFPDTLKWRRIEGILYDVTSQYGYSEIRFPIIEKLEIFQRSIGDKTDIVQKEMYILQNDPTLALRPEGTACCIRACIENGLIHNNVQKLWYYGPMFRHENPQRGRYRQFYQFGVEAIGISGFQTELELIQLAMEIFKRIGVIDNIELHINSLGNRESMTRYSDSLRDFFNKHIEELDQSAISRIESNPMRILDSKNPKIQKLIENAPQISEFIDEYSRNELNALIESLRQYSIECVLKKELVRGLDYYNGNVFEFVIKDTERVQNAVCGGGRYDNLIEEFGGKSTYAVGLAIGIDRIISLIRN